MSEICPWETVPGRREVGVRPKELGRQLKPHSYSQSPVGRVLAPRGGSRRPRR